MMKISIALGLASVVAMAAASPTQAAQGCGRGMHRTPHGRCTPNRMMRQQTWVVGQFYPGRGYWYNNRWYQHRSRWHNSWRYR
jgi:hypothetical protein